MGQAMTSPELKDPLAFAFLDLSNIWYGLRDAALNHHEEPRASRLYAANLAGLLRAGRGNFRMTSVANADVPKNVVAHFAEFGDVLVRESGKLSGTEQANDETLQVRMYEAMHSYPAGVMVLATGDGAGWKMGRGFVPALDAARQHKWGIEIVSWSHVTNGKLVSWIEGVGGAFVDLNDYYYSITFEEGGTHGTGSEPSPSSDC